MRTNLEKVIYFYIHHLFIYLLTLLITYFIDFARKVNESR